MGANFKKAISFTLALVLCIASNVSCTFAAESDGMNEPLTGAQESPASGILRIDSIWIEFDSADHSDKIYVKGYTTDDSADTEVTVEARNEKSTSMTESTIISGTEWTIGCLPPAGNPIKDGYYTVGVFDTQKVNAEDGFSDGYRVTFQVRDGSIVVDDPTNPPWEDVHNDYELTVTPGTIVLEDSSYKGNATPASIELRNSGWQILNQIETATSDIGLEISPSAVVPSLNSGATQSYTVSPDTTVTPGAYSVTLDFTSAEVGAASAASVTVTFDVLKATQAAVTGWDTAAATTDGGLGKITGLSGSAVYELGAAPYEQDDWTSFTTEADGTYEATPGAYKLRLPESDFYESGETSDVRIPGFYNFNDKVIDDMKAGVDINYPVCDLVTGGIEPLRFEITDGSLPAGLTFTTDGYITGSATVVTDSSFVLKVKVTDSNTVTAESIQNGTITIAGIAKGEQATPEAIALTASDVMIAIDNWASGREYAATTDAAITAGGLTWTHWNEDSVEAKNLAGLSPNKSYIVFSRMMGTELLNPSPFTTTSAMTLRTTLASVTISGSGILDETLEAVVSPAAATVSYKWMKDNGDTIATSQSITVTSDMVGKEITLEVTGTEDYQGTTATDPYLVGGCKVSVNIHSYDPNKTMAAVLTSVDGTVSFSAISATTAGIGKTVQTLTFSGVNPNTTYNLLVQKSGHTDLCINGITLGNDDLAITSAGGVSILRLFCGDFNGDNAVRLEDRAMLLQSRYYGKAVAEFAGDQTAAMLDIDGDGYIKFSDLAIVMASENYGGTSTPINY